MRAIRFMPWRGIVLAGLVMGLSAACGSGEIESAILDPASRSDRLLEVASWPWAPAVGCVRRQLQPNLTSVAGVPAGNAQSAANPPVTPYAVVNVRIENFDLNFPPEVFVFDQQTGQQLDRIRFATYTAACLNPITVDVPVFLAHDQAPWQHANKLPVSRATRIEVRATALGSTQTVYAKLHHPTLGGVFVVPVFWHNTSETASWDTHVDNWDVIDLFWRAPFSSDSYATVNSIWAQAGIQFRLINASIPFSYGQLPTHVVASSQTHSGTCSSGFAPGSFNSPDGVDIYTVSRIDPGVWPAVVGLGNCYSTGAVFLWADSTHPFIGGTTSFPTSQAMASLIAHEFGHYLGSLGHRTTNIYTNGEVNLMYPGTGLTLDAGQIAQIRSQLAGPRAGYNIGS